MVNFFENFLFSGNLDMAQKTRKCTLLNANEIHPWTFPLIQIHKHERTAPLITRTCDAAGIEHGHITAFLKSNMSMSVNGDVRPRLTRRRCKQFRVKAHVKEVSMREEDTMSRSLYHRFIIDTIEKEITVAEHTHDTSAGQDLQIVRIGRKVPGVQPQFRLRCTGDGKHIFEYACVSMTIADNSDSHNKLRSVHTSSFCGKEHTQPLLHDLQCRTAMTDRMFFFP